MEPKILINVRETVSNNKKPVIRTYSTTALQHYCTTALLHYSTTTLQHYSTTTLQHYCTRALLHYCTTALQHYCTSALRHYITTALLHYSTTALQPAVNPWLPIHSASKLFQSARLASICYSGEFWQRLQSHLPLIQTLVFPLVDCSELSDSGFLVIRTVGSLRTCLAICDVLKLMQDL